MSDPERELLALLGYRRVMEWALRQPASLIVGIARNMHYNPFATYLDVVDVYRVHLVTDGVVVAVVPGGYCEYRCPTPLWVQAALQWLDEREKGPITGSQLVACLKVVEPEQVV
jgi:hypothetical protein